MIRFLSVKRMCFSYLWKARLIAPIHNVLWFESLKTAYEITILGLSVGLINSDRALCRLISCGSLLAAI